MDTNLAGENANHGENMACLMFVDDDITTLELMERAVGLLGHKTLLCASVSEALRMAADSRPDLILADLGLLRDNSGRLFVNQFCDSSSIAGIPVTVMSAGWTREDMELVKQNGSCQYLEKPIHLDTLSQLIQTYELT